MDWVEKISSVVDKRLKLIGISQKSLGLVKDPLNGDLVVLAQTEKDVQRLAEGRHAHFPSLRLHLAHHEDDGDEEFRMETLYVRHDELGYDRSKVVSRASHFKQPE